MSSEYRFARGRCFRFERKDTSDNPLAARNLPFSKYRSKGPKIDLATYLKGL